MKEYHIPYACLAAVLLFFGTGYSARAEVIYSVPGPPTSSLEVYPWKTFPFNDLSFFFNPGTHLQDFRSPGHYSILTSVALDMGNASIPSGGFSVSIHTLAQNGSGSFDLPLIQRLNGSTNPAVAGSYSFNGLVPLNPNTNYVALVRVEDGGGNYTLNLSGSGPDVGSTGGRLVMLQNDSISTIITNGFNSGPFRLDDLILYLVSPSDNILMTVTATPVDMEGGLQFANLQSEVLRGGSQTVLNDLNNHLFNLRAGGEEEANFDGLTASLDGGVILSPSYDAENSKTRSMLDSHHWEVFSTAGYGYADLDSMGGQAGVEVDSWAPGVGIENRHLARGLTLGFAANYLTSHQKYGNDLGKLDLEGPAVSTYVSYARKNFWGSLLYSFGAYELDSTRNAGPGLSDAHGSTDAFTHAVQFNTGWNFRFQNNTLITGPYAGIDWLRGSIDNYSETGGGIAGLSYASQDFDSLISRVGWSLSKRVYTDWATITPQVRMGYERQNFENSGTSVHAINAPFTLSGGNQNPGQDYMAAGAGVHFAFNNSLSLLLNYEGQYLRDASQGHYGSVRIGFSF